MGRGGLGARHRQSDKMEKAAKYRLNGVASGSIVSECLDKYGRWEFGYRLGVIVRNSVTSVTVDWEDEENFHYYTAGDARYEVDRDRWHIMPPKQTSIFDVTGGSEIVKPAPSQLLTRKGNDGKIDLSPPPGAKPTEERRMTPRSKSKSTKATKPAPEVEPELDDEVDDEVDDIEPELEDDTDDEVDDEPSSDLPDRENYTAKQVASRIGTDAKTLRKFFRSEASTVEPVGQGGRYVFDPDDMPKIKAEFDKWNSTKAVRGATKPKGDSTKKPRGRQAPATAEVIEEDDEVLDLEDDEELDDLEPSDEELDEIDDDEEDDEE